ncbi:NADP-dependent oxidoreductase [Streptacidiphilus sp. P02-A3a]|uniref:NADP-dependent oxidoreductase n=1 Tax=Streptacidiphilus sp. P02-A3a TaxID=2704468 RepID=UPI0015FDEA79|nr:NADP-dependent oxidoreductase [Streptacidiphilus sp. P02-A3a]QMU73427.1 NADP-dependent oxidoreductase [Streptacidiphilus sp. P02-A3a]
MSESTAVPTHAQSVAFAAFGGAEQLTLSDSPVPAPGAGQVLLRIHAVGVNPLDWKIRRGLLQQVFALPLPHVLGVEGSGTVVATGPEVTAWKVGDEVFGPVAAGYAQYSLAEAADLAAKPAELSWELAAALPVAAETAYRTLELLKVTAGETLLVHGAAGAVGGVVVQLAVADGIRVIGTASEANHEYLRELGAIPVSYGDGVFDRVRAAAPQGVDAVLDTSGAGVLAASVELVGGTERVVTVADPAEAGVLGVRFSGGGEGVRVAQGLAAGLRLFQAGTLKLPIRAALPLAEAAAAQDLSEQGHGRGKIVLLP